MIVKLGITVVATAVLFDYTETLNVFASVASRTPFTATDAAYLRNSSVLLHSTGALVLLVVATVLAVFKPTGLTRHGQRRRAKPPP